MVFIKPNRYGYNTHLAWLAHQFQPVPEVPKHPPMGLSPLHIAFGNYGEQTWNAVPPYQACQLAIPRTYNGNHRD